PDWLRDGSEVLAQLTSRARIALFGHKHQQKLHQEEDTVMLTAGAVHPHRGKRSWQPRYNILDIAVRTPTGSAEHELQVKVFPRVWSEASKRFEAEMYRGQNHRSYRFEIESPSTQPVAMPHATEE